MSQFTDPSVEAFPATQSRQKLEPVEFCEVPAAQFVQAVTFPRENFPVAHRVQAVELEREKVPLGHVLQTVAADKENVPPGHALHSLVRLSRVK